MSTSASVSRTSADGFRGVRQLPEPVQQRRPYRRRQCRQRGPQRSRLQHGICGDPGPPLSGERDGQPSFVAGIARPLDEPALSEALDEHRRRALGQREVLGQPGQRYRAIHRYVVQQLPLVLAQIRFVGPVECIPDPAVQSLELFSG